MLLSDLIASANVIFNINILTIFLVFATTLILIYKSTRRQPGVPPGPPLLPVFGNLLQLFSRDTIGTFRSFRQKYGDVYGLYIGSQLIIFLNGYNAIHDALIKKGSTFANRPSSKFFEAVVPNKAISMNSGKPWKELRKFTMSAMKDICSKDNGKNVDKLINVEAEHLILKLSEIQGPFDIERYLNISVANTICTLLIGTRFSFETETLHECMKETVEVVEVLKKQKLLINCFPFLLKAPWKLMNFDAVTRIQDRIDNFFAPFIDEQRDKIRRGEEPTTIVGMYVKRQIEEEQENGEVSIFTDTTLKSLCRELLSAGSETTYSVMRWIIGHLIRNPRIQSKLFSEISGKLGNNHTASAADRRRLPFVEAVIMETLRFKPNSPLAAAFAVTHDISFRGLLIPKHAEILINLGTALKDPTIWENPDEFIPERFLNEAETELVVPQEFIPFSLGPRSCLGESLARMELFLFLVKIVQTFELQAGEEDCLPGLRTRLGFSNAPYPFSMSVKKRNS